MASGPGLAGAQPCTPDPAQVLAQLNRLRQQPQRCGDLVLGPVGALRWSPVLAASARQQAELMAQRASLSHQGRDGASLRQRLRAAGYWMHEAGENLAAGPDQLDETLALWLDSPTHCDNLMLAEASEVGLACQRAAPGSTPYWVLHLARPLSLQPPRP